MPLEVGYGWAALGSPVSIPALVAGLRLNSHWHLLWLELFARGFACHRVVNPFRQRLAQTQTIICLRACYTESGRAALCDHVLDEVSQMLDEPIENGGDQVDSQEPQKTDEKDPYERSSIQFPYMGLDDSEALALAIQKEAGALPLTDDQLAPVINLSQKSSGYRTKLSAARMFGVIETENGKHRLSDLGKRMVDSNQQRAAKAEAFLNIPLYRKVYEEHKGGTIPPTAALQREMVGYGVAAKQAPKARQVMERSAEAAGFYEKGRDRLVAPVLRDDGDAGGDNGGGGAGNGGDDSGDGGTGGRVVSQLHKIVQGMIEELPSRGETWSVEGRVKWLRLAANAFDMIYEGGDDRSIQITIPKGADGS